MSARTYALLLVDDEPIVTETMKLFLETGIANATVTTASSVEQALGLLESRSFDVVITDQQLPGKKGTQLLQEVARRHPRTFRVLLTGMTDPNLATEATAGSAIHGYIQKPYSRKRVLEMVRNLLYEGRASPAVQPRAILEAMGRSRTSRWRSRAPAEGPGAEPTEGDRDPVAP
jgi:DNA-binding NarL/FixJ family response regulator